MRFPFYIRVIRGHLLPARFVAVLALLLATLTPVLWGLDAVGCAAQAAGPSAPADDEDDGPEAESTSACCPARATSAPVPPARERRAIVPPPAAPAPRPPVPPPPALALDPLGNGLGYRARC